MKDKLDRNGNYIKPQPETDILDRAIKLLQATSEYENNTPKAIATKLRNALEKK